MDENQNTASQASPSSTPKRSPGNYLIIVIGILVIGVLMYQRSQPIPETEGWTHDFDQAVATAEKDGQLILAKFYADWCGPCREMVNKVFDDEQVQQELSDWVLLSINTDKQEDMKEQFSVEGIPTIVILNPQGKELTRIGYVSRDQFLDFIRKMEQQFKPKTANTSPQQ